MGYLLTMALIGLAWLMGWSVVTVLASAVVLVLLLVSTLP